MSDLTPETNPLGKHKAELPDPDNPNLEAEMPENGDALVDIIEGGIDGAREGRDNSWNARESSMASTNNSPTSDSHVPGRHGRPPAQRRVRIDTDRRDVVDHRKLARALLRLAQAEYDLQHAARAGFPAPPATAEGPVRPHPPDSAHVSRVTGQPAEPAEQTAHGGPSSAPG